MKKLLFIILLSLAFGQEYIINADLNVKGDIILEGNADDSYESTITAPSITADRTITVPDADVNLTLVPNSLTDGGVLLGSGSGAITPMSVLNNGEMIVGDGSGDPVAESGATLRTSIGLGTTDDPTFNDVTAATFTGDGSALTGIGNAGGVINTGSTTIGADSDSDGSGVIALQTRGSTRITIKNDGDVDIEENLDVGTLATTIYYCSNYDHPDDAITAIGATLSTLVVTEEETCDANVTVPITMMVKFERGGSFAIAGGVTVTFTGQLEAGLYQIFSGDGSVTIGAGSAEWAYPQWWGATPSASSSVNAVAFQAACDAYTKIYIPTGTYEIDTALEPGTNRWLQGEGEGLTIIKNDGIGGVVLYAPHLGGRIDGITIDGNNVSGSIGIQADLTHKPYATSWGSVRVKNCKTYGVYFYISSAAGGIYYNTFERFIIIDCVVGMYLYTSAGGSALINANNFGAVFIVNSAESLTYGLHINKADGNKWNFLSVENPSDGTGTGIYVQKGSGNVIFGGWLEALTVNINIADNPDVLSFEYWGSTDDTVASYTYTQSDNRSILLSGDAFGQYKRFAGRWFFEHLRGEGTGLITNALLGNVGFYTVTITTGTTPSVAGYNGLILNYSGATTITDLTGHTGWQIVILTAQAGHATITNGGNFRISGNWNPDSVGDTITLQYNNAFSQWVELARSDN